MWPVRSLTDLRLAPFQVLAGSAGTFFSRDHLWHMKAAERLASADPLIVPTRHIVADLGDEEASAAVTAWWEQITGAGGEGMVAKPLAPVTRVRHGAAQHGMKCRGPEYLRIIYGPEYAIPANLSRLAGATCPGSGRWPPASSRWGSRRWSGSPGASRCSACTSACSACWRWKASRSTPGSDRATPGPVTVPGACPASHGERRVAGH